MELLVAIFDFQLAADGADQPPTRLRSTTICSLKNSSPGQMHILSRSSIYPLNKIERYPVLDELVPWEVSLKMIGLKSLFYVYKRIVPVGFCYFTTVAIREKKIYWYFCHLGQSWSQMPVTHSRLYHYDWIKFLEKKFSNFKYHTFHCSLEDIIDWP